MRPGMASIAATALILAVATTGLRGPASAQPAQRARDIPQSLMVEHQETLERLETLAKRPPPVGPQARKVLELYKEHSAREQEFILPPLTLLLPMSEGKVTPDMRWAIPMTDRVRAEQEKIYVEHATMIDELNLLLEAARTANDADGIDFAQTAAADSLNDMELLVPMVLVIGDYLHAKLPPAQ